MRARVAGPEGVLDGIRPIDVVVPIPTSPQPDGSSGPPGRLRKALVRVSGVEIVHAHGLKAGWLAVVSRRLPPAAARGGHRAQPDPRRDERPGRPHHAGARTSGVPRADALVAVSPEVGGYVRQHTSRPVRVIRPVGPALVAVRPGAEVRERPGARPGQPLVVAWPGCIRRRACRC